jgi:hypothetical protein
MDTTAHTKDLLGTLAAAATTASPSPRGAQQPHDLDNDSTVFPLLLQHQGRTLERDGMQFVFGSGPQLSTVHVQDAAAPDAERILPLTFDIKKIFTNEALRRATIAPGSWEPDAGFAANRAAARKVYDYYGTLYKAEPHNLLWAGLARLGGLEVFYPGFLLLDAVRRVAAGEALPWLTQQPLVRRLLDVLLPEADILFHLECRLLVIQKKIFDDLAWQHEVYLQGRLDWLKHCRDEGSLPAPDYEAWQQICSDDRPNSVGEGNKRLLRREQEVVIQPFYETLERELLWARLCFTDSALLQPGTAFSALALAMHGSMESFREILPDGDIMSLEDRWRWIDQEVYPCWLRLHQTQHAAISARLQQNLVDCPLQALASRIAILLREWFDGRRWHA